MIDGTKNSLRMATANIRISPAFIADQEGDKSNEAWKTSLGKPPLLEFDSDKTYYWDLETNAPVLRPLHDLAVWQTELGSSGPAVVTFGAGGLG